jgi:MHS family proline/betaine transporter-like MFS transporter
VKNDKIKLVFIASLGTLLEWAEYTFYGYMATKLATLFFPTDNDSISLMKTFGIFASGYLMRPVGAYLFGRIGDLKSRSSALFWSMMLMGACGLGIGLLPTYQTIGFWAPLILLFFRLLQGISVGGEYNGAGIFLTEQFGPSHRCLAGSFISMASAFGMVFGGLGAYFVMLPDMPEWIWRVPFLLGSLSCFLGLWLRRSFLAASSVLASTLPPLNFKLFFKKFSRNFFIVFSIGALTGVFVYVNNVYFVVFLNKQVGLLKHEAILIVVFGEALAALLIPVFAWYADKTGPTKIYQFGLIMAVLFTPSIFWFAQYGDTTNLLVSQCIFAILNALISAPMVYLVVHLFPAHLRYRSISIAYSLGAGLFGGTAPMVAEYLQTQYEWIGGIFYPPGIYVCFFALVTWFIIRYNAAKIEYFKHPGQ